MKIYPISIAVSTRKKVGLKGFSTTTNTLFKRNLVIKYDTNYTFIVKSNVDKNLNASGNANGGGESVEIVDFFQDGKILKHPVSQIFYKNITIYFDSTPKNKLIEFITRDLKECINYYSWVNLETGNKIPLPKNYYILDQDSLQDLMIFNFFLKGEIIVIENLKQLLAYCFKIQNTASESSESESVKFIKNEMVCIENCKTIFNSMKKNYNTFMNNQIALLKGTIKKERVGFHYNSEYEWIESSKLSVLLTKTSKFISNFTDDTYLKKFDWNSGLYSRDYTFKINDNVILSSVNCENLKNGILPILDYFQVKIIRVMQNKGVDYYIGLYSNSKIYIFNRENIFNFNNIDLDLYDLQTDFWNISDF